MQSVWLVYIFYRTFSERFKKTDVLQYLKICSSDFFQEVSHRPFVFRKSSDLNENCIFRFFVLASLKNRQTKFDLSQNLRHINTKTLYIIIIAEIWNQLLVFFFLSQIIIKISTNSTIISKRFVYIQTFVKSRLVDQVML